MWTGDAVVAWTSAGIHEFNSDSGEWTQLPDPGFERGLDRWSAAFRVINGKVYALSLAPGYCNGRHIARWTGTEWTRLAPVDLQSTDYADCSYPNQTGVSRDTLVAWEDDVHYTVADNPDSDKWAEIDTIPLSGTEGPSGPVQLDDGFLVPQYGEAATFNSQANTWNHAVLPGSGEDSEMVWTAEEILMWGWECCYGDGQAGFITIDAWRWTPPSARSSGQT